MSEAQKPLTAEETDIAISKMLKQGLAAQAKTTLTEGVFLVGFALLLGAPVTVIGILGAIPSLTQLLQITSVWLIRKMGARKRVNMLTQFGNRLGVLFMALIPFIPFFEAGYILLIGAVFIQSIFMALGAPSWNSWLRDLVPDDRLGRFFSKRMTLTSISAMLAALLGGLFLNSWNPSEAIHGLNYSVLFFIAFVAGMIAIYYTATTPEPAQTRFLLQERIWDAIRKPFSNTNFRNLIWFSTIWTLSTSLAASFFAVYLLDRLGVDILFASILTTMTQLVTIMFLRIWGRLSDRFSNKSILLVVSPLFVVSTFLWTLSSIAEAYSFIMPLLVFIHILSGFSAAGVNLASSNIGLKLAPRGETSAFFAARGAAIALAGMIGPIIGGILGDYFAVRELLFSITWISPEGELVFHTYRISGLDFVFILSVVIGIYGIHRLAFVVEEGEVEEKVVIEALIAETRRNVRTIATVDGLRQTFQLPLSEIRKRTRRQRRKFEHGPTKGNRTEDGTPPTGEGQ